jgi:O-antigen/teichoic acid export membrane protein
MIDKLKSLSKDTLIYGTSTIVGRFLNFFLVPLYTNLFMPDEFGVVANVYAYIAILNVFFTIGLESGYFKFASTLEVGDKKDNFSHPFFGILLNSIFLSGILFVFSKDLTYLFQIDLKYNDLLQYTALILFFDALVTVPFAYLRLKHQPGKFAAIRTVNIIINVVCNIFFLMVLKLGIKSVFISNLIASLTTFLLLSPIVLKNISFKFNRKLVSELLRFSLPYIPAGVSSNIVQVINRPILNSLKGEYAVGVFQANYRLGIFMMLFVSMFEFAWRPFFLQNAKEPDAKNIFSKVMTFFVLIASFLFIILSFFIDDIAKLKLPFRGHLIGKSYWGGLDIVPIILFSYVLYGIYINLMAGIYIEKKTKYLPLITGVAAVINIAANFLLIPAFDLTGAAIATLLSYFVMMSGIYYYSQKYYYIDYEIKNIVLILTSAIVFYAILLIFSKYIFINIFIKLILILFFITFIFLFKIVNIKSVKGILRR